MSGAFPPAAPGAGLPRVHVLAAFNLSIVSNLKTLQGYENKGSYNYRPTNLTDFVLLSA